MIESLKSWLYNRWPDYETTRYIEGTYGLVFVLEPRVSYVDQRPFCIKTVNPRKIKPSGRDIRRLFEREIRIWLNIPPHYHVLQALGLEFASFPTEYADLEVWPLVRMPFCDADLSSCIDGKITLSQADSLIILAQVCSGLEWLYSHGIQGHGDLKPSNILLTDLRLLLDLDYEGGFPSRAHPWQAFITDLGWADIWSQGGGTYHAWRPYLAPERFRNTVVPEASDIFAVGIIACELLSKRHPAGDATKVLAKKWDAKKWETWATSGPRYLDFGPASIRDLFERALAPDPLDRPSASYLRSVLCDVLLQEYGLPVGLVLAHQDKLARAWDTASQEAWAATEAAKMGEVQLDASIEQLERRLSELARLFVDDDRAEAKYLVLSRELQRLLRYRNKPTDSVRVAALARAMLDRLLLDDRDVSGLSVEMLGVATNTIRSEEVVFELAREALVNLRYMVEGQEELLEQYRAPMERLVSIVFGILCEYWSQRGVQLDERAKEVLRETGTLIEWWFEYNAQRDRLSGDSD